MTSSTRSRRKRANLTQSSLAHLSAEDFMAGFGDSDDEGGSKVIHMPPKKKKRKSKGSEFTAHSSSLSRLADTDPEFYQFLRENDQQLLQFSGEESVGGNEGVESERGDGVESEDGEGVESEGGEGVESGDVGGVGIPEQRPPHITSRREALIDSDRDSDASNDSESEGGGVGGVESEGGGGGGVGRHLKQATIQKWVNSVEKSHSLKSLRQLTMALHSAIAQFLHSDTEVVSKPTYYIESSRVFNQLVVSCLKHIEPCLAVHTPISGGGAGHTPSTKPRLPSTQKAWPRVKKVVKLYLSDLLSLITHLQDASMQCAVIRNVRSLAPYAVCCVRVCRALERQLAKCWASGEHHVQVMAFLALREITLLKPHPSIGDTIKKLYMAFVRNSKFTSSESLPRVRFMQACLVELLSVDTPTSYQLGFVYIRQLAIHLRTAITSGKKDAQQGVYNWQFVHCLDLWERVLGHVTDPNLRQLVYPLVQVLLGTVTLQPSPRYYPLRLHLVRSLQLLGRNTGTFIPTAPLLLEVLENYGINVPSRLQTGKPPDLSLLLRATKPHLQSRAYHSAVLNSCFEQLLEFSAAHSHLIGYPELMFPVTTRIRKVAKATSYSWLRLQLQQLLGKVQEVVTATEGDREKVDFSPSHSEKISVWEGVRRGQENAVTRLQSTWSSVHHTQTKREEGMTVKTVKARPPSPSNEGASEEAVGESGEDVLEDFDLSSMDSD